MVHGILVSVFLVTMIWSGDLLDLLTRVSCWISWEEGSDVLVIRTEVEIVIVIVAAAAVFADSSEVVAPRA